MLPVCCSTCGNTRSIENCAFGVVPFISRGHNSKFAQICFYDISVQIQICCDCREGECDGVKDGIVSKGKASTLPIKSASDQKHKDKAKEKKDKEMKVGLILCHNNG